MLNGWADVSRSPSARALILQPSRRMEETSMADEQRQEQSKPSDEPSHDQERAANPESHPKPVEEAAQEIEAEDRFEATDN
jgi:hypothetical protein